MIQVFTRNYVLQKISREKKEKIQMTLILFT